MTTETATSNLPYSTTTALTLHGPVRLTANLLWYVLFAVWLAYLIFGWQFSLLRAETQVCLPFAAAVEPAVIAPCSYLAAGAELVGQIFFFTAAALLFLRKPNELMTVVASAVLLILSASISNITLAYSSYPPTAPVSRFMLGFGLWLTGVFFLLFPDGRFRLRWTWIVVGLHGLWVLSWWFIPALDITRGLTVASYPILALSMLPAVYAIWLGYRHRFTPTQQQQTKWVIAGVVGALLIYLVFIIAALLSRSLLSDSPTGLAIYIASVWGRWTALSLIPVAILFSIARYRLWDVDLVISRALVTGGVTVILAAVFIAAMLIIQRVAVAITGGEQSSLAVAAASLAVAVLFNPLRLRLRNAIDRRFYPKTLEAARTAARQATRRGSETQPRALVHDKVTGTSFGHYEIEELIGRGGMAEVYRAKQKGLDRIVAVKVLTPSLAQDERFRARFQREARTVGDLRHPNIVDIYDAGEENGTFYMAMEYLRGENLAAYLKREGTMPLKLGIPVLRGVASALDYAHERGVIHRDVKPHNIMLEKIDTASPDDVPFRPVLMDFGIARLLAAHTVLTSGSGALGTLDYISPEQILETSRVDGRADIYSLGVVVYQMFTGELPFKESNAAAVIMSHLQKPTPDPRLINPNIPLRVALAIMRAMAKDPDDRPGTATEFVESFF